MKLNCIFMALFSTAVLVSGKQMSGNDATEEVSIQARGHGCPWSTNQCAFHCRNDVRKNCKYSNKVLKPIGGTCGGFALATCKCNYDKDC